MTKLRIFFFPSKKLHRFKKSAKAFLNGVYVKKLLHCAQRFKEYIRKRTSRCNGIMWMVVYVKKFFRRLRSLKPLKQCQPGLKTGDGVILKICTGNNYVK